MKTNLLKFYILAFVLLSDFTIFAQPGMNNDGGNLEGEDAPPTPINGKIIWLGIVGVLFAIYSLNKFKNKAKA